MTSRISSIKVRTEDMKHRLAMILISVFVFLMKDLFLLISVQNVMADKTLTQERIRLEAMSVIKGFTSADSLHMLYLVPLAMLLAVNGFHYLHSRSRVDLMHSLPVSRGRIFRTILGNDLVIFLVPYLISLLAGTCYVQYLGYMGKDYMGWVMTGVTFSILVFLMHYLLMVFCMIITGQTFVSILAFGVFELYAPLFVTFNLQAYAGSFFRTFCSLPSLLSQILGYLSPATVGFQMATGRTVFGSGFDTGSRLPYIVAILWVALLLCVSYLAYVRYPSERAGSAMTFRRGRKLIKLMIVVPLAMFTGLLFYEISLARSYLWLYFGVVFGVLLFHGIVECIYRFDIRGLWSGKVDLVFIMVAAVLCVLCFDVDIIKFDQRVPDARQVSYVKVTDYNYNNHNSGGTQGIPAEHAGKLLEILNQIAGEVETTSEQDQSIRVTYRYGSGREAEREYNVREDTYQVLQKELFSLKDYKEAIYSIYTMKAEQIKAVSNTHPLETTALNLSEEEKNELLGLLREETDALSYEEMTTTQPVTCLTITFRRKEETSDTYPEGYAEVDEDYAIYPSYKKTIAFLQGQKAVVGATPADCEVSQLVLSQFVGEAADGGYEYENYTIKDPAFIDSVKGKLYFTDLSAQNVYNRSFTENSYVTVKIGRVDYTCDADAQTLAEIYKKALE